MEMIKVNRYAGLLLLCFAYKRNKEENYTFGYTSFTCKYTNYIHFAFTKKKQILFIVQCTHTQHTEYHRVVLRTTFALKFFRGQNVNLKKKIYKFATRYAHSRLFLLIR